MRKTGKILVTGLILAAALSLAACGEKSASEHYKDGILFMESQEYELAEQELAEAVRKNPDRSEYYRDYGFVLLERGKTEEALIQFDKGYLDKDNKIVRENNKTILRGKGIAYIKLKEYEKAKECLEKALDITEVSELDRDILAYLGVCCKALGEYDQALEVYTSLIQAKKSNAAAYADRAEIYSILGETEKASSDYDTAIALDNTEFSYYFGKYNLYAEAAAAGDMDAAEKAQEVLSAAYALKTTTSEDFYNLAIIHFLSGDYDVAAAEMEAAAEEGFLEAYFYLGTIYRQKEVWDKAYEYYCKYEEAVDSIHLASFYEGMADCYLQQQELDKALEMVEKGLALRDKSSQASFLYREVFLYEKKMDYAMAAEKAAAYLEIYPDDVTMKQELVFLETRLP